MILYFKLTLMNSNNEIALLVIDMNGDPANTWNLFCGYDSEHNRIVFFRDLNMFGLPQLQQANNRIWISVERDGAVIESGGPYIVGGHGDQYQLIGFEGIRKEIKDPTKLPAFLLKPNDSVFIRGGDWGKENPINTIGTRRKNGNLAWEVFAKRPADLQLIKSFFLNHYEGSQQLHNLAMARIAFENYPGNFYSEFF